MTEIPTHHLSALQEVQNPVAHEAPLDVYLRPHMYFEDVSKPERELGVQRLENQTRAWISDFDTRGILVRGITAPGKHENAGVPKASAVVGHLINLNVHQGVLHASAKTKYGEGDRRELTPEEYDKLIEVAPNQGLALLAGMLKDVAYPRKDDGTLPVLKPSPITDVQKVLSYGNDKNKVLCGDAEGRFMESAHRLEEVKVGERKVAVRKYNGEDTALLLEDSLLNGVLIPKGSIMIVETDSDGNPTFLFGRLSAFSVDSPSEIDLMAPELTSNQHFIGNAWNYDKIRELIGVKAPVDFDSLKSFIAEVDLYESGDTEFGRIARTLATKEKSIMERQTEYDVRIRALDDEITAKYKEVPSSYNHSDTDEYKAQVLLNAENKQADFARLRTFRNSIDNPRVAYIKAYKDLGRIFGPKKVAQTSRLVAERLKAKNVVDSVTKIAERDQFRQAQWAARG